MSKERSIKLFEQKQVRSVWDDEMGEMVFFDCRCDSGTFGKC